MANSKYLENVRSKINKASKKCSNAMWGVVDKNPGKVTAALGLGIVATAGAATVLSINGDDVKTTEAIVLQAEISKEKAAELSLIFFENVEKFMTESNYNPNGFEKLEFKDRFLHNGYFLKDPSNASEAASELMTNKDLKFAKDLDLSDKEVSFVKDLADSFGREFHSGPKTRSSKKGMAVARAREEISKIKKSKPLSWDDALKISNTSDVGNSDR